MVREHGPMGIIQYVAHTRLFTFLLDDNGICQRVIPRDEHAWKRRSMSDSHAMEKCVGAQYVATLDSATPGGLAALPLIGAPLLFAYVNENGRIALIRTSPLLRFEEPAKVALPLHRREHVRDPEQIPDRAREHEEKSQIARTSSYADDQDEATRPLERLHRRSSGPYAVFRPSGPPPPPPRVKRVRMIETPTSTEPTLMKDPRGMLPLRKAAGQRGDR